MTDDKKVTVEVYFEGDDLRLHVENPCGEKDNPAFLTALLMIHLLQDHSKQYENKESGK